MRAFCNTGFYEQGFYCQKINCRIVAKRGEKEPLRRIRRVSQTPLEHRMDGPFANNESIACVSATVGGAAHGAILTNIVCRLIHCIANLMVSTTKMQVSDPNWTLNLCVR